MQNSELSRKSSFNVEKAHATQLQLSKNIIFEDKLPEIIRFVAGVDVAYTGETTISAVAVLDYDSLSLMEIQTAICKTHFPYIPTLLSFREMPAAYSCIKKLHLQPDVFLVDGHGFAHPYQCGFASHLGLVIKKPTIGVAKSRLFGEVERTDARKDVAFLKHKGKVLGAMITTENRFKPIYVSVGHMISLETATKITKHCICNNRVPKPIREAHKIATREKQKIK